MRRYRYGYVCCRQSPAVDGGAAYYAVKAEIAGLLRQLGVEWTRRSIRTNAVARFYLDIRVNPKGE